MSVFLHTQGCTKVDYEESMWMSTSNDHQILFVSHIDDFIISCVHRPTLDAFRNALLAGFDGTTDSVIQTYLGCEIERDMSTGTKDDCDFAPERTFHLLYHGIVGSLVYLVNMTRPDLVFVYSELSKYVQRPDKDHMVATEHYASFFTMWPTHKLHQLTYMKII
jgi:hypothetical protein